MGFSPMSNTPVGKRNFVVDTDLERLKELVKPIITNDDNSIIQDAIAYIEDLQTHIAYLTRELRKHTVEVKEVLHSSEDGDDITMWAERYYD